MAKSPTAHLLPAVLLLVAVTPPLRAQLHTPQPPPPALAGLVRAAVTHNLALEAGQLAPQIADADVQAAKGTFDGQFQVTPGFGRTSRTIVTTAGPIETSTSTATLNGGTGGLLPYSAASLSGRLPTGTQYGLTFQSARQAQSPLLSSIGQSNAVEFNTALTATVTQPLLRGAGTSLARAGIRAATLGAEASRAAFGRLLEQLIAQVETAYWSLVVARGFEQSAEASLARAQTLLTRNEQMLKLELVATVDVLTARQAVAARRQALVALTAQREDAADALIFLVYGRDATAHVADPLAIDSALLPQNVLDVPAAIAVEADAMSGRRDLQEAKLQLAQSQIGVEVAREALRPSVNLTGSYTAQTNNTSALRVFGTDRIGDLASVGWQGGLQLTVPIGDNVSRAVLQQATLTRSQQQIAVAAVENGVRQDVRQAVRAIRAGSERVERATESLALARQQYDAENQRLQLGLSDSFRLLQFEESVANAEQTLLQARFTLAEAIVAYDLARGYSAVKYGVEQAAVSRTAGPRSPAAAMR